jgi:hypothetical protein
MLWTKDILNLINAKLGYALLHVGETGNNLGRRSARYTNCCLINSSIIKKTNDKQQMSELLNHKISITIFIGIKHKYIKGGLEPMKVGQYNNFIEWTPAARKAGGQMILFNDSHRCHFLTNFIIHVH